MSDKFSVQLEGLGMAAAPTDPVFDAIFDFNEQVIGIKSGPPINTLTSKQQEWLDKFVREELTEFGEAYAVRDVVGMVDAVLDLIYGAFGTLVKMGVTREEAYACMMAIHRANMSKKRGDKGRGSDEDAVKPPEFVPPEAAIKQILFGD